MNDDALLYDTWNEAWCLVNGVVNHPRKVKFTYTLNSMGYSFLSHRVRDDLKIDNFFEPRWFRGSFSRTASTFPPFFVSTYRSNSPFMYRLRCSPPPTIHTTNPLAYLQEENSTSLWLSSPAIWFISSGRNMEGLSPLLPPSTSRPLWVNLHRINMSTRKPAKDEVVR